MKNYYTYGITCCGIVAGGGQCPFAQVLRVSGETMRWTDKAFNGIRARSGTSG